MSETKQKYVRLKRYDEFIIFPQIIEHDTFKHLDVVSAGFCYINNDNVQCFGNSYSLKLKSLEDDSKLATKQLFGFEAMLNLL